MRTKRDKVGGISVGTIGLAVGVILATCSGACADITASLVVPDSRPVHTDRPDHVLDAGAATLVRLTAIKVSPFDAEWFDRDAIGLAESEPDDDALTLDSGRIPLSWDALVLEFDHHLDGLRAAFGLFEIEPAGSAKPASDPMPTDAFDLHDISSVRLVSY